MDQIIAWDREIFLLLNQLGNSSWDGFWLTATNRLTFVPMYLLLLFLMYRKMGWPRFLMTTATIALMILFTDQVTNIFKYGFERLRPCRDPELVHIMRVVADRCGLYGFFSAHASNSMATAIFLGITLRANYKWLPSTLIIWSLIVAYSRIYVGVHFPLDILCGLLFGMLSGWIFYQINSRLNRRFFS
jgi:undecaprenyl-diphosphatase